MHTAPDHILDTATTSSFKRPGEVLIVGIGGTIRPGSSSENALRYALSAAASVGARTLCLSASEVALPFYDPTVPDRTPAAQHLVAALRAADGLILSSPGYHGAISGLLKNALDYTEDMSGDERVYLDGMPVGCLAVANGPQAGGTVLAEMRGIIHALRGFPTPYGTIVVSRPGLFQDGDCTDAPVAEGLRRVGAQVASIANQLVPSGLAAAVPVGARSAVS